ncbi:tafazzin, phospholipid-lysophospholipid transacylase isoform X2 [Leptinotarsa decemlineata]|uniref:tafazzin, phospholipid-lysophospholipid transacylase isoform X2 n=1 Tax=Leptinotarsa decemlineata TaxID=7539 RepID=UPI000C252ED9|nr:tafazzin homolog isoform X2 [Leptinotarsa decemlineata]
MLEKMVYNIDWIIPKLRNPTKLWNIASTLTVAAVGLFSKILIHWLNRSRIHNSDVITDLLDNRPKHVPLITYSNHHSCFDDPGLWGTLKLRHLLNKHVMRWSLAAHDICYTCAQHATFFSLGKCIPVIRGKGVFQDAIDFCIEQLAKGGWVHIFPEGKVNMTKENMRLKWGVGRMIYESPVTPIVVPIWHVGMDDVLPNEPPYVLKIGNELTFNYGRPLDLTELVSDLKRRRATNEQARKEITDFLQETLLKLKAETEELHRKNFKARS